MYGIANCDTIKKAKRWLEENNIEYQFHDYKKNGVPEALIKECINEFGIDGVVNKRGTTYRKLDEATKQSINQENVVCLLQEHSSMIKRPILNTGGKLILGFKAESYEATLNNA